MARGPDYTAFKHRVGHLLLDRVEKYLPGLREGCRVLEFSTPLTNESWVRAPYGAMYGPDQGPDQIGSGRFDVATPVPGLFLCGSGTLGGGVSPCMNSGMMAGKKAVEATGG
jgi:phytoene dehydrogenase-like protein